MPTPAAFWFSIVAAALGATGVAHAQASAPPPVVDVSDPNAPVQKEPDPNAPRIAPPSPEASPQEVEEAKKTAKTAALTPIVPSPQNPLRPAFQLYAELDIPVLAIGLVFAEARTFRAQMAYCAPLCDPNTLNTIDRWTAGYWSVGWQHVSDYGLYAVALGAGTLLVVDEGFWPALNDAVVVAETGLAATALASIMTIATGRPRPYMYGTKAPLEERYSANGGLSFLSSHAAVAFGVATSTFMTMRRLHPQSRAPWIVMAVGGAMAGLVATARVMGGMHFISDSVGGAIVGVSLGVLIPSLHKSPVAVVPVAGDGGQRGIALAAHF
jgi:membrane-associated phospholipid phosphatase